MRTSYQVVGDDADEFAAICFRLGLRPHQLVRRLVDEGIARHLEDPDFDERKSRARTGRTISFVVVVGDAFSTLDGDRDFLPSRRLMPVRLVVVVGRDRRCSRFGFC